MHERSFNVRRPVADVKGIMELQATFSVSLDSKQLPWHLNLSLGLKTWKKLRKKKEIGKIFKPSAFYRSPFSSTGE
jgi:hypothetical protein